MTQPSEYRRYSLEEAVCKAAIEKWGSTNQMRQAQEECAELIVAISHILRGRGTITELAEEMADVEIMIGQLKEFIGPIAWRHAKEKKIKSLELRIVGDLR